MAASATEHGPPQAGDNAVDFELLTIDGEHVRLSNYWHKQRIALVFLRHLGCTFCRQQLAWLRRDYEKFKSAGAEVVCVAQGDPKVGKAYAIAFELPFPLLLCGDDCDVYRQYGLLRGTLLQLLNPVLLFRGLISTLQGHIQTKIEGDPGVLGGAFVIDTAGIVQFAYRSKNAGDTVHNECILEGLRRSGQ